MHVSGDLHRRCVCSKSFDGLSSSPTGRKISSMSCKPQTLLCGSSFWSTWFLPDPLHSFGKYSCTDSSTPWILCTDDASDRA